MKPQEYLKLLREKLDEAYVKQDMDEIYHAEGMMEGAETMYELISWGWKKYKDDEEYKAKKRAYQKEYYRKNKERYKKYQKDHYDKEYYRKYRREKRKKAEHEE